jgi:hypothetical protein
MVKLNTKKIWDKIRCTIYALLNSLRNLAKWIVTSMINILQWIDKNI